MGKKNTESLGDDYKNAQQTGNGDAAGSAANASSIVGSGSNVGTGNTQGSGSPMQPAEGAGAPKVDGAQAIGAMAEKSRQQSGEKLEAKINPSYIGTGYSVDKQDSPSGYGGAHGVTGSVGRRAMRMGETAAGRVRSDNAARPNLQSLDGSNVNDQVSLETVVAETLIEGMMAPRTNIPTEPAPTAKDVTGEEVSTYYVLDANDHSYDFVKGIAGVNSDNFNTSIDEVIIPGIIVHDDAPPVNDGIYEPVSFPDITTQTVPGYTADSEGYSDVPSSQVRAGEFILKEVSFATLDGDGDNQTGSYFGAIQKDGKSYKKALLPKWDNEVGGTFTGFNVHTPTAEELSLLGIKEGMIPVEVTLTYQDVTQDFNHAAKADKVRFSDNYRNIRYNRVQSDIMDLQNRLGNNLSPEFQPFFSQVPELVNTHLAISELLADQGACIYAAHKTYEPALANMMAHIGKTADAHAAFGYFLTGGMPYSQQVLSNIGRHFSDLMSTNYRGNANVTAYLRRIASRGAVTGACTAYDSPWKGRTFLSLFEASKFNFNGPIRENLGKIGNFAISKAVKKRIDHAIEYGPMEDEATGVQPIIGGHHLEVTHHVTFGSYYTYMFREDMGNNVFKEHILMFINPSKKLMVTNPIFGYKYTYTGNSSVQYRNLDVSILRGILKTLLIDDIGSWRNRSDVAIYKETAGNNTNCNYRYFMLTVDNNMRAPSMWHYFMCKSAININKDFHTSMYDLYKYMYCKDYLKDNDPNDNGSYDVIVRKLPYSWLTSFLDSDVVINSMDGVYSGMELSKNGRTLIMNGVTARYTKRPRWAEDLIWFGDKYAAIQCVVDKNKVQSIKYADPEIFVNTYPHGDIDTNGLPGTVSVDADGNLESRRVHFGYPSKNNLFQNKDMSLLNWRNINGRDKRKRKPPYVIHPVLHPNIAEARVSLTDNINGDNVEVGINFSTSRNATPGAILWVTANNAPTAFSILKAPRERRTLTFNFAYEHYAHYFVVKSQATNEADARLGCRYFSTYNPSTLYIDGSFVGGNCTDADIYDPATRSDANNGNMFMPQCMLFETPVSNQVVTAAYTESPFYARVIIDSYTPTYVAFRFDRPSSEAEWNDAGFLSANKSITLSPYAYYTDDSSDYKVESTCTSIVRFENWISAPITVYSDRLRGMASVNGAVSNDEVKWMYATLQAHQADPAATALTRLMDYNTKYSIVSMEPIVYKLYNDESINEFDQFVGSLLAFKYPSSYGPGNNAERFIHPFARWAALTAGVLPMEYQLAFEAEMKAVRDKSLVLAFDPFYDFEEWKEQIGSSLTK